MQVKNIPYKKERPKRHLYELNNPKKKEKPTLEGKIALRAAISLESLQNEYIDIHNQMTSQIYQYLEEINIANNSLVDLALEKIFLQKLINTLVEYLSQVRKRVINEMKEIVKIFNEKLELIENQEAILKEKEKLNVLLKRSVVEVNQKYNSPSSIDSTSTNPKNVLMQNTNLNYPISNLNNNPINCFETVSEKFTGYDFDLNEFITHNNSYPNQTDERNTCASSQISESLWSDFFIKTDY